MIAKDLIITLKYSSIRCGSRAGATSKMEGFVIIVKPLNIITKHSILAVVAALDPSLSIYAVSSIWGAIIQVEMKKISSFRCHRRKQLFADVLQNSS